MSGARAREFTRGDEIGVRQPAAPSPAVNAAPIGGDPGKIVGEIEFAADGDSVIHRIRARRGLENNGPQVVSETNVFYLHGGARLAGNCIFTTA